MAMLIAYCEACVAQQPEQATASPQSEVTETPNADIGAIHAQAQAYVDAFNNRDAESIAALWTEDGEYVDEAGQRFVGRDAIEQAYTEMFAGGSTGEIRIMVDSVRLLSPNTAIEDGRAVLDPAPAGAPGHSRYTAVHVKRDGTWLMASVRDAWEATASAHPNITDLQWLVGTWTAEEHGTKMESVCNWVANKSFVERKYTTTEADGTRTSGVQLIGWNPEGGHVQSWNFSPDGGHAIGVWTPHADGWSAEMHGVTGDGVLTTSVNVLTRLDDNAYVWQSVQRTYDDQALPDTGEIVLRRQSDVR
jgi:uncharacterized protein (TIGR02246 family)